MLLPQAVRHAQDLFGTLSCVFYSSLTCYLTEMFLKPQSSTKPESQLVVLDALKIGHEMNLFKQYCM